MRIQKQLKRFILVNIQGIGKFEARIHYDRLYNFRFFCGRIEHIFTKCNVLKNSPNQTRFSSEEFLYPKTISIHDQAQLDISFHQKLFSTNVVGLYPSAAGTSQKNKTATAETLAQTASNSCTKETQTMSTKIPHGTITLTLSKTSCQSKLTDLV